MLNVEMGRPLNLASVVASFASIDLGEAAIEPEVLAPRQFADRDPTGAGYQLLHPEAVLGVREGLG